MSSNLSQEYFLKELKIEVTHDCLLKCVHCSSLSQKISGKNMKWDICKKILADAISMGINQVAFSGGEPLLCDYIQEAVMLTSKNDVESYLYTTGNAPDAHKILTNLQRHGLSRVMFSIFDADEKEHEDVTKVVGSFRRTIDLANYCVKIGLETEFHFVPMLQNYKSLISISEMAMKLGVKRVSVLRLVPQGRGAMKKGAQLNLKENIELRDMIYKLRNLSHDIRVGSPYNFLMLREKPRCNAAVDRITIGPDLRIHPCDAFKHIFPKDIGITNEYSDLNDHSLQTCWNKSPYLNKVRKHLSGDIGDECNSCQSLEKCNSGCLAQKFYAHGRFSKIPDPLCLLNKGHQKAS